MLKLRLTLLAAAALLPLPATAFFIELTFTGGLTASQEAVFEDAATTWETLITGYRPGINRTGIGIDVEAPCWMAPLASSARAGLIAPPKRADSG